MTHGGAGFFNDQQPLSNLDFLTQIVWTNAANQTDVITQFLKPWHTALMLELVTLAGPNVIADVSVQIGPVFSGLQWWEGALAAPVGRGGITDVPDRVVFPLPAAFITDTSFGAGEVDVVAAGVGGNLTGRLNVYGVSQPSFIVPRTLWRCIGHGNANNVVVAIGATSTILAAPLAGEYYRIKDINCIFNGIPAANSASAFSFLSDGVVVFQKRANAVETDPFEWTGDLECDDGIQFQNLSGVACTCRVVYERWGK